MQHELHDSRQHISVIAACFDLLVKLAKGKYYKRYHKIRSKITKRMFKDSMYMYIYIHKTDNKNTKTSF